MSQQEATDTEIGTEPKTFQSRYPSKYDELTPEMKEAICSHFWERLEKDRTKKETIRQQRRAERLLKQKAREEKRKRQEQTLARNAVFLAQRGILQSKSAIQRARKYQELLPPDYIKVVDDLAVTVLPIVIDISKFKYETLKDDPEALEDHDSDDESKDDEEIERTES